MKEAATTVIIIFKYIIITNKIVTENVQKSQLQLFYHYELYERQVLSLNLHRVSDWLSAIII